MARYRETGADCALLSVEFADPTGYGRVIRGKGGNVAGIVEEGDATPSEKAVREINVGCYVFDAAAKAKPKKSIT